jgi:hypothetical protein
VNWAFERTVLELRYRNAFRMWDRSGEIVVGFMNDIDGFQVISGTPEKVELANSEQGVTIAYGSEIAYVKANMASCSKNYLFKVCEHFLSSALRKLEVQVLSRVGNRLVYQLEMAKDEESKLFIHKIAQMKGLGIESMFEVDANLENKEVREFSFRFADDKTGINLHLKPITTRVQVEAGAGSKILKLLPAPTFAVELDVDVFTTTPLPVGAFLPVDFIKSNLKMLETRLLSNLKLV